MAKQAAKSADNTTRWIVVAMVALVVVTGIVFSLFGQTDKSTVSLAGLDGMKVKPAVTSTIDVANGSSIAFDNGAVTTIDVWEDPQCPVCKLFTDANGEYLESLVREQKATVRYHMLSFLGDESVRAANASFCAADEGQFLDFHKAIYTVQSSLENSGFWSNETLVSIGKKIGIESTTFEDCVNKGSKVDLVQANADSMSKFGIQGTPTVFINGKKWERTQNAFVLEEFKAAVEAG
jgi:protein-disulfide isomerase